MTDRRDVIVVFSVRVSHCLGWRNKEKSSDVTDVWRSVWEPDFNPPLPPGATPFAALYAFPPFVLVIQDTTPLFGDGNHGHYGPTHIVVVIVM